MSQGKLRSVFFSLLLIAASGCLSIAIASGLGTDIVVGPTGPSGADRDSAFRSLAIHPTDADIVIVGTERNGIVLSVDGGRTWSRKRSGLWHWVGQYPEVWDIAFDTENPDRIYAATLDSPGPPIGEYPSASAGLYRSINAGESWLRSTDTLPTSRITSVEVAPDTVVLGAEGGWVSFSSLAGQYYEGGLYWSSDFGQTWQRSSAGEDDGRNGYWQIDAAGNELITFGLNFEDLSENFGFLRSRDGGRKWEQFADELRTLMVHSFAISSDGQTLYANERDSYVLLISSDKGATWRTSSINQANGPVAVSPTDDRLVLYAGGGRLYRSSDGVASFTQVLQTPNISDIVFAPSDPTVIYVVADGYLIFRSGDAGRTFSEVANLRTDALNH
ncbi:WD40/YVTN/BNR-like repeat-containing protein [Candidatus Bipolaricaulota bacterium]